MQKLIYVVQGGSLESPDDAVVITSERGTTTNYVLNSPRGLGAVNTRLTTTTPVGLNGEVLHSVELEAREVSDTIHIQTTGNRRSLYKLRADLESKLNPLRGMGTLYYANDYGMWKIQAIPKVYGEAEGRVGLRHSRANVSFYCPDPFWQDITATRVDLYYNGEGAAEINKPAQLPTGLSDEYRNETVLLSGDADADTVIRAHGRFKNLRVVNETTGDWIEVLVDATEGTNNEIIIDSKADTVTYKGTELIPEFGSSPIKLARGVNRIVCYFDLLYDRSGCEMFYTRRFVGV